jgi:TrpR family trp operon transcriptional repressor
MKMVNEIVDVLCQVDDRAVMKGLVGELFTPSELTDIALRWRLLQMLHQSVPQRQIASQLGVSLCKITRGSKVLKKRASVTRKLLDSAGGDNGDRQRRGTRKGQ